MEDLNYRQKLAQQFLKIQEACIDQDYSAVNRQYWVLHWLIKKHRELESSGEVEIDSNTNNETNI